MEGWVGLVGWPIADALPTKWSHVNYGSGVDQGKSAGYEPTFLPLSHAANQMTAMMINYESGDNAHCIEAQKLSVQPKLTNADSENSTNACNNPKPTKVNTSRGYQYQ